MPSLEWSEAAVPMKLRTLPCLKPRATEEFARKLPKPKAQRWLLDFRTSVAEAPSDLKACRLRQERRSGINGPRFLDGLGKSDVMTSVVIPGLRLVLSGKTKHKRVAMLINRNSGGVHDSTLLRIVKGYLILFKLTFICLVEVASSSYRARG